MEYGLICKGWSLANWSPFIYYKRSVCNIEGVNLRFHTEGLFKKYEILKLEDLFTLQTNSFMYKFINSKCPSSFNNFFVPFRGENCSKSFIIDILKSQKLEHFPSFFHYRTKWCYVSKFLGTWSDFIIYFII